MKIVIDAMAISRQPKRFIGGLYQGPQTMENIQSDPHFVLQLPATNQYRLVDLLGNRSGRNIDKAAMLEKRGCFDGLERLPCLKTLACRNENGSD